MTAGTHPYKPACYSCCWKRGACSRQQHRQSHRGSKSSPLRYATVAAANSQPRMRWMRFGVWVRVRSSSQHRRGAPVPGVSTSVDGARPKANCCLHVCDAFLPARPTRLHTDAPTSALPSQRTVSLAAHSCAPRRTCTHVHLHLHFCAAHAKLGRTLVVTAVRRALPSPPRCALTSPHVSWWDDLLPNVYPEGLTASRERSMVGEDSSAAGGGACPSHPSGRDSMLPQLNHVASRRTPVSAPGLRSAPPSLALDRLNTLLALECRHRLTPLQAHNRKLEVRRAPCSLA